MQMHISQSIEGALNMSEKVFNEVFEGVFSDDEGKPLSAEAARIELEKERALGHKLIRSAGCDNFDPIEGCLGHEDKKMNEITEGAALIQEERTRQKLVEKFSDEHDDQWVNDELLDVAYCYLAYTHALTTKNYKFFIQKAFKWYPKSWSEYWWKPSESKIRNLVKAGALIAAEIDRLKRMGEE
jgi:hypothetical protein